MFDVGSDAVRDQFFRKTVPTWELSCFSPVSPKQGFRDCSDSLDSGQCQCSSRSAVSLGGILMFLTDYLLKYCVLIWSFQLCVCTEPHPAKKGKKILDVFFTAGSRQIQTKLYCQWHQILHHLPSLETPNSSPRPRTSCRLGVWKRSIWFWQVHCRPPPKPENIHQNDLKPKLTSDGFATVAPIYVIKSCIFRARKNPGDLQGQHPHPTTVNWKGSSKDTFWLVTETGTELSQASWLPTIGSSHYSPAEFPENQNIDKTLTEVHKFQSIFATTQFH